MDRKSVVFAPSKVEVEHGKIEAYFRGERIYPTTIELDLSQICSRSCPGCPYAASRKAGLTLQIPFLDRLFSILGPHTPGIVLSGGEPTIVPHFGETVALARKKGFKEIAVISNGGDIHLPSVQDALLEQVTSIRISMYDWQDGISASFTDTLKKIEALRNRIEKEGSRLEVGASMLTRSELNHRYEPVGLQVIQSGIDWLYFHPYCVGWDTPCPVQSSQAGVLEALENLKQKAPATACIQVPFERYHSKPLFFEKLHGAHFLIQVGADGVNYLGPECKYEEDAELLDLNQYLEDDFLWHPQRLQRLNEVNSDNYRFIGTKHRPPMFSDYIQRLQDSDRGSGAVRASASPSFSYPFII